ncbi:hypothetical protein [Microtetraspora malaysiensis]|uniref:hypothetical protein n=1 Tax=Microtetraspora malaysiensis TaxID=161358 RepID=UPI003D8E1FD8
MLTPDGWTTASNPNGNCLEAKRASWGTSVRLRETGYDEGRCIFVYGERWRQLLDDIKADVYTPPTHNGVIILKLGFISGRHIETTRESWDTFREGVRAGVFDAV